MSTMNSVRGALRLVEERPPAPPAPRTMPLLAAAMLAVALVAGLAQLGLLPGFSADDAGSLPFHPG